MKTAKQKKELDHFLTRYQAILEVAARRVHWLVERGSKKYIATADLAEQLIKDPFKAHLVRDAWWAGVKAWRVTRMLQDANFLGAYASLDIRAVRGKGVTTAAPPRQRNLRVLRGGRS